MTPKVRAYAKIAAANYGITEAEIFSQARNKRASRARAEVFRKLSDEGFSSGQIGHWMGRDGSTVRYALARDLQAAN